MPARESSQELPDYSKVPDWHLFIIYSTYNYNKNNGTTIMKSVRQRISGMVEYQKMGNRKLHNN